MLSTQDTVLLVIDMQNGFLEPGGSMAKIGMDNEALRPALAGCVRLVEAAREANVPVVYTRYVYQADYADAGLLPTVLVPAMKDVDSLAAGSWDADLVDQLTPAPGEIVIDKSRPSAFYGTRLEPVLTSLGARNLVLCGVTTNICIETTARDAGQRDYHVHVAADATAEFDPAKHEHALGTIGFAFGWVDSVDDVLGAWSADPAAG